MNAMAALSNAVAGNASAEAGRDALIAGYQRRRDDWIAQSNAALREMAQIDKQLAGAGIRRRSPPRNWPITGSRWPTHARSMSSCGTSTPAPSCTRG